MVLNKGDAQPSFDVNRKFLRNKYKGIRDFYRVSCKTGHGIDAFFKGLREYLPGFQDDFHELKELLIKSLPGSRESLKEISDSLDQLRADSVKKDKEKLTEPMNKMRRFLKNITEKNSDLYKVLKKTKKGIEKAQKVGKTYNKFVQWLALPQVPDIFLGKD